MAKIKYNGKEYEEPNAAWSQDAPAMYRETPEALEQRWTAGYGGAGYKQALANYDNLSPLEQDILNNVTAKGQAAEAAAGLSGGYGGNYGGNYGGSGGYKDSYAGQIKSLTDKLTNLGPFSYDYNADPLYQQYAKEYTRLGQRAMDDTLAKISARTGGLASSYAASAGNQAYGNYMQQLSNKIPELYKLAYDMYNDDYNRNMSNLNLLRGLSGDEYSRFANERSYADSRADLAYNRALDAENLAYNRAWNEEARDYGRNQDADKRAVYAFSDNGGDPYRISSLAGLNYLDSIPEGGSVTAGDGSIWSRQNGQIIITDRNGRTYRYGEATPTAPTWYWTGDQGDKQDDSEKTKQMSASEIEKGIMNYMQASAYSGQDPFNAAIEYANSLADQGLVDEKVAEDAVVKILGGK